MDPFVKAKLHEWDLDYLQETFEENMIDKETFLMLAKEEIKELIPKVGPRMKFVRSLESLKREDEEMVPCEKRPAAVLDDDSEIDSLNDSFTSESGRSTPSISPAAPKKHKASGSIFGVREVLDRDFCGAAIISEMEKGELSGKMRKQMVRILVSHLIEVHGDRPRSDTKIQLAKQIISEFPLLKESTGAGYESYYTPGSSKHPANGFLEIRLRNVRRSLSSAKEKPKKETKMEETSDKPLVIESTLSEDEASAMVAWLKANRQPEQQVRNYMKQTAPERLQKLKSSDDLGPILLTYPRLLDTPGMIEQDFSILCPEDANKLYQKWDSSNKKIIEWASRQGINWEKYLDFPETLTEEQTSVAAFNILPCILPTGMAVTGGSGGKRMKFSKTDALKSFIDCQPIGTNLPQYLKELEKDKSRSQPFVLVLGNRLEPQQHFLIVERIAVPQSSTLAAIDACYKSFYILNVEYPAACKSAWQFLQIGCYNRKSSTGAGNMPALVRSLITFFNSQE